MTRAARNVTCLVAACLATAALLGGCEGSLFVEPGMPGAPPPGPPLVLVDGGPSDAGGGGLELCLVPPGGECVDGVARWCDGTRTLEEVCPEGCALDPALQRYACIMGEDPPDDPPPDDPPPDDPPPSGCGTAIEQQVIAAANEARASAGAGPLTCDPLMTRAARLHSEDMCAQMYFSHNSLDGRTPFQRMQDEGVSYSTAGENIAQGQSSAAQVHSSWMGSSGHRANILNGSFGRVGVGYADCAGRHYWTQNFAN